MGLTPSLVPTKAGMTVWITGTEPGCCLADDGLPL
jgi:hypothetical protein